MADRKPGNIKFQSWIDQQINRARNEGAFDDLPGAGKPDPNPGAARDPEWWAKSFLAREGLEVPLPPALELRSSVQKAMEELDSMPSEQNVRERIQRLNARIRQLNSRATSGPPTNLGPLDEEEIVERWRSRRAELGSGTTS